MHKCSAENARAAPWPDAQGSACVEELLRCKSVASWDGVCTKLDLSVIIQRHTEFRFGKATCTVFGYLQ